MSITTYNVDITIAYGGLKAVMEWCENNCQCNWVLSTIASGRQNEYVFLFESDKDAVLFTLRWL